MAAITLNGFIPIDQIAIQPDGRLRNIQTNSTAYRNLRAHIKETGLMVPIRLVYKHKRLWLVDGLARLLAVKSIQKEKKVPRLNRTIRSEIYLELAS